MTKLKNVLPVLAMLGVVFMGSCQKDNDPSPNAPEVTVSNPANNATGVALNIVAEFNFSKAMDPATIHSETFFVTQGLNVVPGTVSYSGKRATFTATSNYAPGTVYISTITMNAKDLNGQPLAHNIVISFTTSGSSSSAVILDKNTSTEAQ